YRAGNGVHDDVPPLEHLLQRHDAEVRVGGARVTCAEEHLVARFLPAGSEDMGDLSAAEDGDLHGRPLSRIKAHRSTWIPRKIVSWNSSVHRLAQEALRGRLIRASMFPDIGDSMRPCRRGTSSCPAPSAAHPT